MLNGITVTRNMLGEVWLWNDFLKACSEEIGVPRVLLKSYSEQRLKS
jgi:hypothetical protein